MNIKVVEQTIIEIIKDKESELYIRIYLNDLTRSKDITNEQNKYLYNKYVIPYTIKNGVGCY